MGQAGRNVAQVRQKGDPLLVSGRLDQQLRRDKDGNKRQAVEVNVEDFNFIGGSPITAGGGDFGASTSSAPSKSKTS